MAEGNYEAKPATAAETVFCFCFIAGGCFSFQDQGAHGTSTAAASASADSCATAATAIASVPTSTDAAMEESGGCFSGGRHGGKRGLRQLPTSTGATVARTKFVLQPVHTTINLHPEPVHTRELGGVRCCGGASRGCFSGGRHG